MLTRRTLVGGALAVMSVAAVPAVAFPSRLPWMRMHELLRPVNQGHEHGAAGLPDWYDPQCCNQQDCRPEPIETFDYVIDLATGKPGVLYKPTGHVFTDTSVRPSQDERYHVCTRVVNPGTENEYIAHYCVYIPGGV